MSYFYKVGLQNFRVFDEMTEFELAPLTILTGANSSGKSSLFKSLLLIGTNIESNSFYKLDFTGTKHNLGSFNDTLNKSDKGDKIVFRFYLSQPFLPTRKMRISSGRKLSYIYLSAEHETNNRLILEVKYKEDNNNGLLSDLSLFVENETVKITLLEANVSDDIKKNHKLDINLKWFANNLKIIREARRFGRIRRLELNFDYEESDLLSFEIPHSKKKKKYEGISTNDDVSFLFNYFFSEQIAFKKYKLEAIGFQKQDLRLRERIPREIEWFIKTNILHDVGYHLENMDYIEAVRAKSRRIYTHDSQTTLFDELLLDYNSIQLDKKSIDFLKKWIREFEIADDIEFENLNGIATSVNFLKNGTKYPLADLGYGVTQYLPLLLKIALQPLSDSKYKVPYRDKPIKKTLIIEEPETNLHPKLQSKLSDMFLDALSTFEIKFIIETHSEYLIRRLQILVAEKEAKSSETSLYYFYEPGKVPNGRKQVERITIMENGNLDNDFGEGFFDEATKMKFELLKLKKK